MVKTLLTYTGVIALAGFVALPASGYGAERNDQQIALEREATDLVERTDEVGREIHYHVDRLTQISGHAEISRWSHFHHLERIKFLMNNDLRPVLVRLVELQKQLPAWKQESVSRMVGAAQQLAMDANSAIFRKAESGLVPAPINESYRQFIAEMSTHAAELVATADFAHKFASLRLKALATGPLAAQ